MQRCAARRNCAIMEPEGRSDIQRKRGESHEGAVGDAAGGGAAGDAGRECPGGGNLLRHDDGGQLRGVGVPQGRSGHRLRAAGEGAAVRSRDGRGVGAHLR